MPGPWPENMTAGFTCQAGPAAALHIHEEFQRFYAEFLAVPEQAKRAFEQRNHPESIRLSALRLQLYSKSVADLARQIPVDIGTDISHWAVVETCYRELVKGLYHEDLALAYLHSVRRRIYHDEWRADDSSFRQATELDSEHAEACLRVYPFDLKAGAGTLTDILEMESLAVPYADLQGDANLILDRLRETFAGDQTGHGGIKSIEMFRAGFYRNRGAYLVGRLRFARHRFLPFIVALLNDDDGIYVDALITGSIDAHNIFSSTLANFHVTNIYYHELCLFLCSIMPMRPLGLHYSTIGYNHFGKLAVMNEIEQELRDNDELLNIAAGSRGTVAIGFSSSASAYSLKVIRDLPTEQYKWGEFDGVDSVLRKYHRIHEINRTGSMLDSIIYYNLSLSKSWFHPQLQAELLDFAGASVTETMETLKFRYLIVQRKMTPLPVYLETAGDIEAQAAIVNLGHCIRNNAAANIFNKDLDARNYGISAYRKIYLFDYDALEPLTAVKVRSLYECEEGEDDVPDWFYEDGVVFLPEEIITGLCLPFPDLRRLFREKHRALLETGYWEQIQAELRCGTVPGISVYPDSARLIKP